MFHSTATTSLQFGPVAPDWTIAEFVEWIAADDARCHDDSLLSVLTAIDRALERDAVQRTPAPRTAPLTAPLAASSPVPLVRALAVRLRREPALRQTRVRDLISPPAPAPAAPAGMPREARRGATSSAPASVRPMRLRVG
jgi:hypothetical protein